MLQKYIKILNMIQNAWRTTLYNMTSNIVQISLFLSQSASNLEFYCYVLMTLVWISNNNYKAI